MYLRIATLWMVSNPSQNCPSIPRQGATRGRELTPPSQQEWR